MPEWLSGPLPELHSDIEEKALERQSNLTKPPGSLGRLEAIAVQLCAITGKEKPSAQKVHIAVFASDHGIAAQGVSAFPQEVTAAMIQNFASGGAAISVLAKELDATLEVINLGTVSELPAIEGVVDAHIGPGTADFSQELAMDENQLAKALHTGRQSVERAQLDGADIFVAGEMGIANTTSATALACALLHLAPYEMAGRGTGVDDEGLKRKISAIEKSLRLHHDNLSSPWEILGCLGGFEIAAMAGAYIAAARMRMPAVVDGFIATAAALVAEHLCPGVHKHLLFGHRSAEQAHRRILDALHASPILDLDMRLGEGSGAAMAIPAIRMACALHNNMATFAEAEVSEKI